MEMMKGIGNHYLEESVGVVVGALYVYRKLY